MVFGVCLFGWTLTNLDQSLFSYAVPGIRREFGKGLEQIAWILSVSFALASVSAVMIAADIYGRKIIFVGT
jgi:MFS family permease